MRYRNTLVFGGKKFREVEINLVSVKLSSKNFRTNTVWKGTNHLIPSSSVLNSTLQNIFHKNTI